MALPFLLGKMRLHTLINTLPIFDPPRHMVLCSLEPEVAIKGCNVNSCNGTVLAYLFRTIFTEHFEDLVNLEVTDLGPLK